MGQLQAGGYQVDFEGKVGRAGTVVINTCGFVNDAKEESIDTILQYIQAKQKGKIEKLYVMGCLSQRYITDLQAEIPDVDKYFGVNNMQEIVNELGADFKTELIGERKLTTPSHYAYLKISEGCDRRCTFCSIPSIRGKHKSRPLDEIIAEARRLTARGVKELMMIAQDLTYYGIDLYKENRFSQLLTSLSDIKGIDWIRLHYAYPAGFPMEILPLIAERPNICNYIDMPIQHINNRILSLMQRGHTREGTIRLLSGIRETIPDAALRTTLIVGFPGETDEEFEELIYFIKEFRFHRLGVFAYSHEDGTTAFKLDDNVPAEVKQQRLDKLMEVQQEVSLEYNQRQVGKTLQVMIDRKEGDYFIGRTEYDSPEVDNEVLVNAPDSDIKRGKIYPVLITKADYFDLYGTVSQF